MRRTKLIPLSAALVFTFFSCNNNQEPQEQAESKPATSVKDIQKLSWLIGLWENESPEGRYAESWKMINDSVYSGHSSFVRGKDTASSETLGLAYVDGVLNYMPTVKNQNNGEQVRFKLKNIGENTVSFENPKHDFPQVISYTLITKDSAMAEISGTINGEQKSEQFPMKRVK